MRLEPGISAPAFSGRKLPDEVVTLSTYANKKVWLCLSRYAACPFCSVRIHMLCASQQEIAASGVRLVVVFPSPAERIQKYINRFDPTFDIIADPDETIFQAYAAETSWTGELRTALNIPKVVKTLAAAPLNNPLAVDGPIHRMPCEFLIDEQGQISRAFYGRVLDDGLPISEVLEWAGAYGASELVNLGS